MGEPLLNHSVIIDKAYNDRRVLSKGFVWQGYRVGAVRRITKEQLQTVFGGKHSNVEAAYEDWEAKVNAYVNKRCATLGLWVGGCVGQLVEEPNESKLLEKYIWESKDTHCVFSLYALIKGAVKENEFQDNVLPLFSFWPWELNKLGDVPEVVDAEKLTLREQGKL